MVSSTLWHQNNQYFMFTTKTDCVYKWCGTVAYNQTKNRFFFQQHCIICLMCKVSSKPHSTCACIPTTPFLCGLIVKNDIELIQKQLSPFIGIIEICINCPESSIIPEKPNVFCNVWPLCQSCWHPFSFLKSVLCPFSHSSDANTGSSISHCNKKELDQPMMYCWINIQCN